MKPQHPKLTTLDQGSLLVPVIARSQQTSGSALAGSSSQGLTSSKYLTATAGKNTDSNSVSDYEKFMSLHRRDISSGHGTEYLSVNCDEVDIVALDDAKEVHTAKFMS